MACDDDLCKLAGERRYAISGHGNDLVCDLDLRGTLYDEDGVGLAGGTGAKAVDCECGEPLLRGVSNPGVGVIGVARAWRAVA